MASGYAELVNNAQPNDSVVAASLCSACGLCCNGVLFGDVELQPPDTPEKLASLGLELWRKGRKLAFLQPCACFDGQRCRMYEQRPTYCRAFECGVLKRVQQQECTPAQALALIKRIRRRVANIQSLLRALGNNSDQLPLTQRYREVMAQPFDLAGDRVLLRKRAQLLVEMDQLRERLGKHFVR